MFLASMITEATMLVAALVTMGLGVVLIALPVIVQTAVHFHVFNLDMYYSVRLFREYLWQSFPFEAWGGALTILVGYFLLWHHALNSVVVEAVRDWKLVTKVSFVVAVLGIAMVVTPIIVVPLASNFELINSEKIRWIMENVSNFMGLGLFLGSTGLISFGLALKRWGLALQPPSTVST